MTDHHPPPPRLFDLRTAPQILHQTTLIFSTRHHLHIFLILSFLLFSLRTNVENLTHFLTSYVDNDPSIESLLSPSQPPPTIATTHRHHHRHRHRRRPFLQLTRVGLLDDDFLSRNDEFDNAKPQLNDTSFILDSFDPQFGFSNFISDNGIRVSEIVRSNVKMSFRSIEIVAKEDNNIINDTNERIDDAKTETLTETKTGLGFLFDLDQNEVNTLLSLIGVLSASYGLMILLFVFTHVWVHGVVFVVVVNDLLNRYSPFRGTFETGAVLGSRRLAGFVIMRWVVRDVWTQLLGVMFFGETDDQYSLFKIFVRLKFMPFSTVSPWVKGFEKQIYYFLLCWFLLDMVMSFVFALDAWVAMVDTRRTGREVVVEGWHLLSLMIHPAINLKCLEGIACGSFGRHVLTHIFGKLFASMIQCFMEVYFMVAWIVHYFCVKSMDAEANGTPFGNRELEAMLVDDR